MLIPNIRMFMDQPQKMREVTKLLWIDKFVSEIFNDHIGE
jgi:hypothetical protein